MGIKRKLGLIFLIISLMPITFLGFLIYDRAKESLTEATANNLNALATEQKARLTDIAQIYKERLVLVSAGASLGASVKEYNQAPSPAVRFEIESSLAATKSTIGDIQDISVAGLDGKIYASTTPGMVGTDYAAEEFFQEGKAGILRPAVMKDPQGKLMLRLAGPIVVDNAPGGVIILTYPARYLENLANDYTGLGQTGEFSVVERAPNGDALAITPLRFDKDSVLKVRAPKDELTRPAVKALSGKEELFTDTVDYRNQKVLTATRYLPELDWGLVVKVDQKEAYAPIEELRSLLILFGALFSFLIIVLTLEITRAIARPLLRLSSVTERISEGDFTKRIQIQSKDEIGELGHSINHMAERLQTLRDNLESTVEERTELLRAVTESASDAIISMDEHGRIISWNKGAEEMFGHTEPKVIGKELSFIFPKRSLNKYQDELERIRQTDLKRVVGVNIQFEGLRTSNQKFPIEISLSKWTARNNTYFTAIIRDVTERQQAFIRASQLAAVVNAASDAIISYDLNGKILSWNKGAEAMYGSSPEEMIGKSVKSMFPPEKHQELEKILKVAKRGGSIDQLETERLDRDKNIVHVSITVSPIRDTESNVVAVSSIARDVSRQQELLQRQRDFVSIASHELRTPLTALMGYLSMVGQTSANAEQATQFINRANAAARRLSVLVEDLLSVARIEDERLTFAQVKVHPVDLIGEHLTNFQPIAEKKNIGLKFSHDLKDGDLIEVDRGKFDQVMINLIDNAIKYTPEGGKVAVKAARHGKDVSISVTDTGIGIHPDNIERIFEKFYREYTDLSVTAGGTGLGLFITKELVERQGGTLSITSSHGKGTTAIVRFPKASQK